ncbi:acetyltransferase [Zeaxanthinibacter enoshimensis]|uniref:Sugar O-acyltransferase (Sialic acid O-acetyltransferase NeuD family) n=1 Tax=Zeaxanthinibacter enoshimensis TaxID=392009 RepID=A0A4R6TS39_9FLAO|nr:acetyltransferase [Zeaxanthinibacter enoshimensis]TDQ33396.1 sugar O-acyltransferase (sialic acid O-acetyltransferase NeuD family) [Zeaxanthinibacter enoshimensis]
MKNVVIFGASGHGSVVLDCIEQQGKYNVVGFVDSFKKKGRKFNGYEILGSENDLPYLKDKFNIKGGIVAIGDNWIRKIMVDKITAILPGFNFITAIHPRTIIGRGVVIGRGTVIMPGTTVNANSIIGDFCILNTNSSLDHDGHMKEYSSLAPMVCTGGNLELGQFSVIGLGTNVIESISIGDHTVIGAGSLLVHSMPGQVVAYGSPARIIRGRVIGEPYLAGSKKSNSYPLFFNDY